MRTFVDQVEDKTEELVGAVLFGSGARGEADRTSDIDVLLIVEDDKARARRTVQSVVSDLESRRFDENRYTFQSLVESTDSVPRIGDQLRPQFNDGITLVGSDQLVEIKNEVYADGE